MTAPTLTPSAGTTNFVEGDNTTSLRYVIDPGMTIADVDSTTFASATVSIASGFQSGADRLRMNRGIADAATGNITQSWSASTGVLSLNSADAAATLEQWQAALRLITFTNTSESPVGGDRTISFVLNDGTSNSAAVTNVVNVGTVNDASSLGVGRVTTDFGASEYARAITVLTDGKILVSGISSVSGVSSFAEARYNTDGSLDSTFGTAGVRTTEFVTGLQGNAIFNTVMGPDGKAIALGYIVNDGSTTVADTRWALARYTADGSLDTTFDVDGKQTVDLRNYSNLNHAATQSDGKILITGDQGTNPVWYGDTGVLRLNVDGSIDTSFGTSGLVTLSFGTGSTGYRVLTLPNDKILVVSGIVAGVSGNLGLTRLNSNGTLDTSFDGDGIVTTSLGASYFRVDIDARQQTDQKIVVLAAAYNALTLATDAFLLRYNTDGTLDTGFDADGKVAVNGIAVQQVALQTDGGILVTGGFEGNLAVVRYNTDGSLDTTFGTAGRLITDFGATTDAAYTLALDAAGKLVVAGGSNGNFALARYNSDGSLDTSFSNHEQPVVGGSILLDGHAAIADRELALTGYGGSSLVLARDGGANANDFYVPKNGGTLGNLTEGSTFSVDGVVVGTVAVKQGGSLELRFTSSLSGTVINGASQALVNSVLQQLAYGNTVDPVGTTIQIAWTFNDGNSGAQGPGGAHITTGTTAVTISAGMGSALADSITGTTGNDRIDGGAGNDTLTGLDGNDTLVGGAGDDSLDGGAGSDYAIYNSAPSSVTVSLVSNTATGGDGSDSLIGIENISGSPYADILIGDANANILIGRSGDDTLTGGAGSDTFAFQNQPTDTSVDTITDFAAGSGGDSISINTGRFINYISGANAFGNGYLRLTQVGPDTVLELDADGTAGPATFQPLAILSNVSKAALTANNLGFNPIVIAGTAQDDTLTGTVGNDQIYGNHGNDSLSGATGNDNLYGGPGDDTLDGGAGTDRVLYVEASGPVTVNLSAGNASGAGVGIDTLIGIENVTGSPYADTLIGDANSNILVGGLGNDTLTGGAGADTFQTSAGATDTSVDTITDFAPGAGGDILTRPTVLFSNYNSGANPFSSGHVRLTQSTTDTLFQVDVDGPSGPAVFQTLTILSGVTKTNLVAGNLSNFEPNVPTSTAGPDLLTGTAGNDNLDGGAGNDTISGLAGNDTLYGGLDNDVINGGDGNDQFFGNDGNDSITGGAGSDNFVGGAGNDTLDGGADSDYVHYYDATGPVTVNLELGTATGAGIGTDTLISIENVYGSQYADTLIGDANNNSLFGDVGNDTLTGGAGSDYFQLRTGSTDTSVDTITDFTAGKGGKGSSGVDNLYFSTSGFANYTGVNPFASGHGQLVQAGADTLLQLDTDGPTGANAFQTIAILSGVTKGSLMPSNLNGYDPTVTGFFGGATADALSGTAGVDYIDGAAGNDTLTGLAGNDTIYGGLDNDVIDGGDGSDQLYGNDGDDSITGGAGYDNLYGGLGNDTLDGGADNDSVQYSDATGPVTVNLALGTATGAGIGTDTLISIENVNGSQYSDTLIGGKGNDYLSGQGGNDTLIGGLGDDYIQGAVGSSDSIDGGDGNDVVAYNFGGRSTGVNFTESGTNTQADGFGGTDTLLNIEQIHIFGSSFNDTLVGDTRSNWIFGNGGNDTLTGGGGNDTFAFDVKQTSNGVDRITDLTTNDNLTLQNFSVTSLSAGNDASALGQGAVLVGTPTNGVTTIYAGVDTVPGADLSIDLQGSYTAASLYYNNSLYSTNISYAPGATITGTTGNDNLNGTMGPDSISGLDGRDNLSGQGGNDTLMGGLGDDYIQGAVGSSDSIDGGDGNDVVAYGFGDRSTGVNFTESGTTTQSDGFGGTDTLLNIEQIHIFGSNFGDTLVGDTRSNWIFGNGGNDTLTGGGGNDTFAFDVKQTSNGVDRITDLTTNDNLTLQNFSVTSLSAGNDASVLGQGAVLVGTPTNGVTTIYAGVDTVPGADLSIDLQGSYTAASLYYNNSLYSTNISYAPGATITGTTGNDNLNGTMGPDSISGLDGHDNLTGQAGNDTLTGGAGSDNFQIRSGGNDTSVDVITDFTVGKGGDNVGIPTHLFTNYTNGANPFASGHVRLTPSGANTQVELDVDGPSGPGNFQVAAVLNGVNMSALASNNLSGYDPNAVVGTSGPDSMTGTVGNDSMDGAAGNDTMNGLAGNDTLAGGPADDLIDGGAGSDTAVYSSSKIADWSITAKGDGSFELLQPATGERDTLRNIENVQFQDSSKALAANFWASPQANGMNNINGSEFGDMVDADALAAATTVLTYRDWINTGAGNDSIKAGQGGDEIDGGAGNDTIDGGEASLAARLSALLVNLSANTGELENRARYSGPANRFEVVSHVDDGSVTGTAGGTYFTVKDLRSGSPDGTDTVFNIDALQFTDKQVRLSPNVWVNRGWDPTTGQPNNTVLGLSMEGTSVADSLGADNAGFAGSDRLTGNQGNDTLRGGAGADTLRGDEGNDRLDGGANRATGSTQQWDPNGSNGFDVAEYAGKAERYTIARLTDTNSGAVTGFANSVYYTVTDSKLAGGDGVDILTNIEVLRFADGEKNLEVVTSPNQYWVMDPLTRINTLTVVGTNWNGTDWADNVDAAASEVASGKIGKDNVRSGAGNDNIKTGGGGDFIEAGPGNDTVDGGANGTSTNSWDKYDIVRYDASQNRFTIALTEDSNGNRTFTVTDKVSAEFGGLGTDRLSNVEILQFNDGNKELQVSFDMQGTWNQVRGTDFSDTIDTDALASSLANSSALTLRTSEPSNLLISPAAITTSTGQKFVAVLGQMVVGINGVASFQQLTDFQSGQQILAQISLTAQADGKLSGSYEFSNLNGRDIEIRVYGTDSLGLITGSSLANLSATLVSSRDNITDSGADDVVYAGAGGDNIMDSVGNDFYDGGADGNSKNAWENPDRANFSGAQKRYLVEVLKYAELAVDSPIKAKIDAKYAGNNGPANVVRVTDKVPDGDGVNYLINVEQIQFIDGVVNLGVTLNQWSPPPQFGQNDVLGSNNYTGGILNDLIDASGHDAATLAQGVTGFVSNRDWIDGGIGNDTLLGGAGADQLQGGRGDDVLDGGTNPAIDPLNPSQTWDKNDEARYSNSINRYDISFFRLAKTGETAVYDDTGLTVGVKAYVLSAFYDPNGFISVKDHYTDSMGGDGRDVLRNIETLGFSDSWEQLKLQSNDNVNPNNGVTNHNVYGSRFGDRIDGISSDQNYLQGNAGNDSIMGGALRDELTGGTGNDTLDGGANPAFDPTQPWDAWNTYDVARFDAQKLQFQIDRLTDDANGTVTGHANQIYYQVTHLIPAKLGGLGTDIVFNIERLQFSGSDGDVQLQVRVDQSSYFNGTENIVQANYHGTMFADSIVGTSGIDNMDGGAGDDTISGGAGNDFLAGGAGNDQLMGGDGDDQFGNLGGGNDSVDGGADFDRVIYDDALARYSVQLVRGAVVVATFDKTAGFGGQTYNSATDTITVTDRLAGLYGGEGVDSLMNVETIRFSTGEIRLQTGDYWPDGGAPVDNGDPATGIAGLDLIASGSGPNSLWGGNGNDTLIGAGANDNIQGNAGADSLVGGGGDDFMVGGRGKDTIDGGDGTDVALFGDALHGVSINLLTGTVADDGFGNVETIASVENLHGSAYDDVIQLGSSGYVFAGAGNDSLIGGAGSNQFYAGSGNDTMNGGAGDDWFVGEAGNDLMIGGSDGLSDGSNGGGGDVANYQGAPRQRFDVLKNVDGSFSIIDIASIKAPVFLSDGHLNPTSYANIIADVSAEVGYGIDTLWEIERAQFSDGQIDLAKVDRQYTWQSSWWNGQTQVSYQVTRHDITGTFLDDVLMGSVYGDQIDGRAGNDTIDGGVETATVGNPWEIQDIVRYEGSRERYEIKGVLVQMTGSGASKTYTVVNPIDAGADAVFGLQIRDVLSAANGGSGTDLLVNVERVDFAAGSGSNGSNSINVKPEYNSYADMSMPDVNGVRPQSLNARGTDFDDALNGTPNNDWLNGNAGNDTLVGGAGGDDFDGGAGDDLILGGVNGATDQWGNVRTDTAHYNAAFERFDISTVLVDLNGDGIKETTALQVMDRLPSDDSSSLGTDTLVGVESLAFNNRWVDVSVRRWEWTDSQQRVNANAEGTVFDDVIQGDTTTAGVPGAVHNDQIRGNAGNDVLIGGGGGDNLQGGEGNDVIDGGANGTSGNTWQDQDQARYVGNSSQYLIQHITIITTGGNSTILADDHVIAGFNASELVPAAGLAGGVTEALRLAYKNLNLADAQHQVGYLVVDTLSADLGGEGVDLVFNVETLWFANGSLEVDIRANTSGLNANGRLDWVNVTGTANADAVDMGKLVTLTARTVAELEGTRIDVDLREGNDVYIGGSGGESIRTGPGNDYVDGGANTGTDQWGNALRDEVRFEGNFSRYNLIDVTLTKTNGNWALSSATSGLTVVGATISGLSGTLSSLDLTDFNSAITTMIAKAGSQTTVVGWLVADRLPSVIGGSGVDALVNIEALSFSDKWMPLSMQVNYQRDTSANVVSAHVDGTQGNDTIGYVASPASGSYNYIGDDNLRGNEGNDTIFGGTGGDWISGGAGDDVIDGGTNGALDQWGNTRIDTVQYSGDFDRYTVSAHSDGSVTVVDSQTDADGSDTLTNVEALGFRDRYLRLDVQTWVNKDLKTGKLIDIQVNGSMLSETIDVSADTYPGVRHVVRGNEGNDTLIGGAGPDEFEGGTGDDSIVGGANGKDAWGNPGFDVARYPGAFSRYTIEYSSDGATWGSGNPGGVGLLVRVTDSFSAADGGQGVDILSGIEAMAFFDRFLMIEVSKTVQDLNGDGVPDAAEIIGTDSADNLIGDATNDHIRGNAGNDTLSGGIGGDILNGGVGNDLLDGGADGADAQGRKLMDVAEYAGPASLYTVTRNGDGSFTVSSTAEGTDTLTNIEGLQFSDRFVSLIRVTNEQDLNKDGVVDLIDIRGLDLTSAGDVISPATGKTAIAHHIAGGYGNDTLAGGSASDVIEGGVGNDAIDGGGGTDRAVFSASFASYTITYSTDGATWVTTNPGGNGVQVRVTGTSDGTDTLSSIEELAFSDKVVKLGAAAVVSTKEVDTDGNQKVDTAYTTGTDGNDVMNFSGSTLINFIDTGVGDDSMTGGSGADTFIPGTGNDTVVGGANAGLDAAGAPNVDRAVLSGAKADYMVKTLQSASFAVSGAVEVGDVVSVTVGSVSVSYTATATTLAALKTGLDAAIGNAKVAGTLGSEVTVTSALNPGGSQIDYVVKTTDALAAIAATTSNGTHSVTGSFAVSSDAIQTGSSLKVASATGLATGMFVSYAVTAGTNSTSYGPYKIASISGTTLTLTESMGASPSAGSALTVIAGNTDTSLAAGSVAYDRWFEVATKTVSVETDTLREIEQLVFSDGVMDLSFKTSEKAVFGATGLTTVIQIQGTDLADVMRSSSANEIFTGGSGADHFVFADGSGTDEIRGFVAGSSGDRITLLLGVGDSDGLNATGVDTTSEALARASQQGGDVMIDLGAGNSIKLTGVMLDDLRTANFEVVAAF